MRYLALWSQKEKYGVKFKIEKKRKEKEAFLLLLLLPHLLVNAPLSRLHFVVSRNIFVKQWSNKECARKDTLHTGNAIQGGSTEPIKTPDQSVKQQSSSRLGKLVGGEHKNKRPTD